MHFPKPVVLLLGGLLTVTGIGCSAASALFTDMRPAPTVQKSSSERMLAIGRMFEEQGRLDRAEAMYRGAVKKNPRDQAARESLANVQSRRKSPQVGGDILAAQPAKKQTPATPVSSASPLTQNKPHASGAKTPAIIPQPASSIPQTSAAQATPAAPAGQQQPAPIQPQPIPAATPASSASSFEQKPLSAASATASQSATSPTVHPAPATVAPSAVGGGVAQPVATDHASKPIPAATSSEVSSSVLPETPSLPPTSAPSAAEPALPMLNAPVESSSGSNVVTLDDVLAVVESPAEQKSLLIRALHSGDTPEVQCLAAALLGECGGKDADVTAALEEAGRKSDDPCLVLAVLDSQLHQGNSCTGTASNLLRLLPVSDSGVQIQGVTSLRHFSGTESRSECVKYLSGLLDSGDHDLRAAAVLALGDMGPLPAATIERLEELSKEDECDAVRESAAATLARPLK